ncbi:hypothetical protein I3843_09G192000 [Carya illinoinensis]|nr:hypothetical protein I3843_09G192000 [Carya illinoinensis]
MFSKLGILLSLLVGFVASEDTSFTFNRFRSATLSLDGKAEITANGLLKLTNDTKEQKGHAFYPNPISFKNSLNGNSSSFSTTFVFSIISQYPTLSGHGIAFVIAPTKAIPGALPSQYRGLFKETNNGNSTNHAVAIELDTILNTEFADINDNHVGIDINGLNLISGHQMQVWVDYDGVEKQINVTLAPINVDKPKIPLLSLSLDLSPIINDNMYVGFSSSTGSVLSNHYVLGWSFKMNGQAPALVLSQLPKLPRIGGKKRSKLLTIGLPMMIITLVSVAISAAVYVLDYGPHRFKYKDLYIATKGFKDKELLGVGGFDRVYRGVLPTSNIEIAMKKVSHESRQGMREFVAEIVSIGRLRHRNLVSLLGYCRCKGELLLVYDYMPYRSLDRYLFGQPKITLNWEQRFRVLKGVASGLLYLHEEWKQVVVHRDVKASNVLLDGAMNGRLGDFGLARLYDRGTDPQTTHVVGTLGYLAPEHTRSGKATTSTDVFAFGAFLLEVACGRRPIEQRAEDSLLVDWVFSYWNRGEILEARDRNLGADYVVKELELVLKLGLLCSHTEPAARPSMRQVVQYLEGDICLPELPSLGLCASGLTFAHKGDFTDFAMSYPSSINKPFSHPSSSSVAESLLSGGR